MAKEVHRLANLGVQLADSIEGRMIVQNRVDSLLVVEVKENQYNDPFLVQLKEGIHKHKTMDFSLGMNNGALRFSPMKGIMRFGKKGKLSPRSIGLYRILQKIGQVAYRLELPLELSLVHRVFHVSMLKKVVGDPSLIVPVEAIEVNVELTYEEIPVAIIDRKVRKMRNKKIASVKVLWQNQQAEEATCEAKKDMERKYPHLFVEPNGCA
ncbi:uncharacterized protein [Nicotiana tomentosiformis]|uniref:uncharacterized protein n=1 Tax=Nicotiana tomentosiformis TaxID=4098 RepID=UPI00388C4233